VTRYVLSRLASLPLTLLVVSILSFSIVYLVPGDAVDVLGGENLTFADLFDHLSDISGLAPPGRTVGPGLVQLVGWLLELRARLGGPTPLVTHRLARDYSSDFVWVTSEKAEQELGYTRRPAREALSRSVRYYLERGYVPDKAARRVRLELRPT